MTRHYWLAIFNLACLALLLIATSASAQTSVVIGTVRDRTGGVLPGVTVELRSGTPVRTQSTDTNQQGQFRFDSVSAGPAQLTFALVNFGVIRRDVTVGASLAPVDVTMQLSLSADVIVTGKRTFTNLADVANPAEDLVGIAQSSSQGAVTAAQLDTRPIMRVGEVLETVPGVIISQHSGEGKANQYYLRGFNLDHGTDFATTVAGMPANMPTHGHGHGYTDLNFMIPELVSGVQYSKGPYFADQGDFATAGSANINYVNSLDRPIVNVGGGDEGYARGLFAGSRTTDAGTWLGALEIGHNDGPWDTPDHFKKFNGVARFTKGDSLNGLSITGMGYHGTWTSTDQIPKRAVDEGLIGRFGSLDDTDGGDTYRYSGSLDWQRSNGSSATRLTAYGIGYNLNLFSNFTYFLDDPDQGDQFHQADHRFVSGAKLSHRQITTWGSRSMQNSFGGQLRNDNISKVGLYHTAAREQLAVVREDSVAQTGMAAYAQNEISWNPWLRTLVGVRGDGYRFSVDANNPLNSGGQWAGIVSPKGGVVIGPIRGTEFYVNAGIGFHSNDARGATITVDPVTGDPADSVTPLAKAKGAEVGVRTVAIPHLQSSLTVWTLSIDSELIFIGDAGSTEAGRPSHRRGVEFANYYSPIPVLTIDADVSWSHADFTDDDPVGNDVPGAISTVVSGGITLNDWNRFFGSARLRYFGPRALTEDNSIRSEATSLVNLQAGFRFTPRVRLALDVFNLFDAKDSDIDYYYDSRLPGEPDQGVADIHFHPTLPRTARLNLILSF